MLYKYGFVSLLMVLFLTLSGCAVTTLLNGEGLSETSQKGEPVLTDTLLALGKVNEVSRKNMGLEQEHVMVLIGQSNSYILTKGGDKLFFIAKGFKVNPLLNADKLSLVDDVELFLDEGTVWGGVTFRYDIHSFYDEKY